MKTDTLSESQLEKKFVGMVQQRGGLARKFVSPNQKGVPDRITIWGFGLIHFVELKTRTGKLTKLQLSEQQRLKDRGCKVFTLYGLADVEIYIAAIEKELRTSQQVEQLNKNLRKAA